MAEEPMFYGTEEGDEEILEGDTGATLVVRRMCLTPHANEDEWLYNVFQSTYTIQGNVCHFVIDLGGCPNILSTKVVQKLGVKTETYSKPYKVAWLKKGGEVTVSKHALVFFLLSLSIRTVYDVMW